MSPRPNVIFIYADDLGRGLLSCHGQRHFRTPNIDRLAGDGLRFERAYGCAYCAPSRASLLTGMHDCHRGRWTFTQGRVYDRLTRGELSQEAISELIHTTSLQPPDSEVFLPQLAREAGLVTAQIGKLEWGFATSDRDIRRHGWDYHYGFYDHVQCHGYYPPYLFENGTKVDIPGNTRDDFGVSAPVESPENQADRADRSGRAVYSQDLFDEKILRFLRENVNRPFFLYHPSQLPHGPVMADQIDPSVKGHPELTLYEREYASMVIRLDRTVGLILDEIRRLGIEENTLVFFVSDNGHAPTYRQPGRFDPERNLLTGEEYDNVTTKYYTELSGDVFNGNDGMAGRKFYNWEGGIRLPYMARWPGVIDGGRISQRLIANYDFMPTLAELLGLRPPAGKDGISFLAELTGAADDGGARPRPVIVASRTGPAIVRDDGWKLKQATLDGKEIFQLFHLPTDYREEHDRSKEHPELVRSLGAELLRECDCNFLNGTPAAHMVFYPDSVG